MSFRLKVVLTATPHQIVLPATTGTFWTLRLKSVIIAQPLMDARIVKMAQVVNYAHQGFILTDRVYALHAAKDAQSAPLQQFAHHAHQNTIF